MALAARSSIRTPARPDAPILAIAEPHPETRLLLPGPSPGRHAFRIPLHACDIHRSWTLTWRTSARGEVVGEFGDDRPARDFVTVQEHFGDHRNIA
jgi:hypothetical protein